MAISQVENLASPRNDCAEQNSLTKTSWAMSSAMARSRQKRQASVISLCCQRTTIASNALLSPAMKRAMSAASWSSVSIGYFEHGTRAAFCRSATARLLLKTLADSSSAQAREVLDYLREEDRARTKKKEREERRGWTAGGLILLAVGIALAVMAAGLGTPKAAGVGLIPFLIGCVLLGIAGFMGRGWKRSPMKLLIARRFGQRDAVHGLIRRVLIYPPCITPKNLQNIPQGDI